MVSDEATDIICQCPLFPLRSFSASIRAGRAADVPPSSRLPCHLWSSRARPAPPSLLPAPVLENVPAPSPTRAPVLAGVRGVAQGGVLLRRQHPLVVRRASPRGSSPRALTPWPSRTGASPRTGGCGSARASSTASTASTAAAGTGASAGGGRSSRPGSRTSCGWFRRHGPGSVLPDSRTGVAGHDFTSCVASLRGAYGRAAGQQGRIKVCA